MKDLREQTPVFITDSKPHVIMYSAHAVRRYKERMGLDAETEFVDVCKHMFLNGCINPRVFGDMRKIYGTNINRRELSIISTNGAYMGFADGKTEVFHAETFLSAGELRKDQLFLDASKSEDLKLWKTVREAFVKGEITSEELQSQLVCYPPDIAVSEFMRGLKYATSYWLKHNPLFPLFSGWGEGYAAFTYSKEQIPVITQYIINQKAHHHKTTFAEEYRQFIIENGGEINENYFLKD